ncbi:hypothetical protein ACOMHN_057001 [Nucella lapillus]
MSADANGRSRHIAEAVHGKVEPAIRARPTHPPGKGWEGLAQPAAVPKPASRSSPTDPVLRANPFPERLCTLETCCGYGYGLARESHRLRGIFKGRPRRTGHRKSRGALRKPRVPISGQADSRERVPYKEKRTLPGVSADVSHFVCVAAHGPGGPISVSRFGNINPIPFRSNESTLVLFYGKQQCFDSERTSPIS